VLKALRELDVLGERMYADGALSFAVRAMAFDGSVLLHAFGLLLVQGWRDLHLETNSTALQSLAQAKLAKPSNESLRTTDQQ